MVRPSEDGPGIFSFVLTDCPVKVPIDHQNARGAAGTWTLDRRIMRSLSGVLATMCCRVKRWCGSGTVVDHHR